MRKDAIENRKRIEEMATTLFHEHGVENVSMNQISKALNIGMGTLYRHFTHKSDLCYQLIENDFENLMHTLNDIAQSSATDKDVFIKSIDYFLAFKWQHKDLLQCVESAQQKRDFKDTPFFQALHDYYYALLEKDVDADYAVFKTDALLGTLTSQNYTFQMTHRARSHETYRNYLVQLFFNHY